MPDRCDRRCSTVTPSSITGRSLPRTERAGVESSSTPSSIRLTTASAVKPFAPLAIPKRVSTAFGISKPRCAKPYALASSIRSRWSIRTTPENPVPDARASSSPPRSDMRQTLAGACIRPPSARAHPAAHFPLLVTFPNTGACEHASRHSRLAKIRTISVEPTAMDMLPGETELLDRQRALQMEAEQVAQDIMLMELAQTLGDPVLVGSAAL